MTGRDSKSSESPRTELKCCIAQFAKSPLEGGVKTRLAPALNEAQRRQLHLAMTRHICQRALQAKLSCVQLWLSGPAGESFSELTREPGLLLRRQEGEDLGERLLHAAEQILQEYDALLFIGSDCPFIDVAYLQAAAASLRQHQAVIGPASDGGYVLLGLRQLSPALFQDIAWGSDQVLAQTESRLARLDWSFARLPTLADIDRPEDLPLLATDSLPADLRRFAAR